MAPEPGDGTTLDRPGPVQRIRDGLGGLTFRGRAFVAGGITAALCGVLLGERDLVRVGAVIVLLPLVTIVIAGRSGQRLTLVRTLPQTQIEINQPTSVTLELTNLGPTTGVLLTEEQVPWALGHRPRFVLGPVLPRHARTVEYLLSAEVRGIYDVGPLLVRITDPFGMLDLRRTFTSTSTLVVVPAAEKLPAINLVGARSGNGEDRPRPFSHGSAADVTVREYRLGDDLRRVHWRSSARTGELMVRREEEPWQARCTLFIDNRTGAHRGTGPDSSFERAVTAAASIAVHLAGLGFQVRLVSADGDQFDHGLHQGDVSAHARPVLQHLAALRSSRADDLSTSWIDESVTAGTFIGVFGTLTARDQSFLSRLHTRDGAPYALSLDIASWTSRTNGDHPGTATSTTWLRQRGWKAAELSRFGSLPAAWQELGR